MYYLLIAIIVLVKQNGYRNEIKQKFVYFIMVLSKI